MIWKLTLKYHSNVVSFILPIEYGFGNLSLKLKMLKKKKSNSENSRAYSAFDDMIYKQFNWMHISHAKEHEWTEKKV